MTSSRPRDVPAVRIEAENEWAWCGGRRLTLMPRTFAVLRHLVEHAGRLVTKQELLSVVWRDTIVSDAALTSCIRDLRRALGDSAEAPRYIETVHRRGFRFIGPIVGATIPSPPPATAPSNDRGAATALVGRDAELARLRELLGRAMRGRRQLVFVTGEPGIGKTALVDAFVEEAGAAEALRIGHGQCVEHYGAGEAYLPVLEALGRLGRAARGDELVQVLKQHAPTWLAQLPALVDDVELENVQRRAQGATRERMLRELVEALDALAGESPLILVLEDLHWSDSATIDLLAMLARRREPARLLVLGTYRPADVALSDHPLKATRRELELHGRCEEIPLDFLTVDAVEAYLGRRFAQQQWPAEFPGMLHRRTDGNPLFLVNVIDDLLAQGRLRDANGEWVLAVPTRELAIDAPETLAQMVEKQIERLTPAEQAMLAVASVAGAEFSAAVAAVDGIDAHEGEQRCEALARRGQFVRAAGVSEWPDGTVAGGYAFIHALYQQTLYARISVGRRISLHVRTGERLEQAYGAHAPEIAGELAMHFTLGRDAGRAARYHGLAGEHALRQHGYREAADHVTQALGALQTLPDTPQRREQELMLHVMLGSALTAMKGHAAPEVEATYARARELCEQVEDVPRLFPVLLGLGWFYTVRGNLAAARDVGRRMQSMAEATGDPAITLGAHHAVGQTAFYAGEFATAIDHLERGIRIYDPSAHSPGRSSSLRLILDAGMSCTVHAAWAWWFAGYPDRATRRIQEALALSRSIEHPFTFAHAGRFAAAFHLSRREPDLIRPHVDESVAVATEHGFGPVAVASKFHLGWLLLEEGREDEGLALMQAWVTLCRQMRSEVLLPTYLGWMAEVHGKLGHPDEALAILADALAMATASGTHYWTAELHRVRGTLMSADKDAEAAYLEAIAVARSQGARSLELRAATSLCRLWARRRKRAEARALLAEVRAWFTEGLDTPDLTDASALLAELGTGLRRSSS